MFGERALVHRCHRHKERNVTDLLPERDRPAILARIRGAWTLKDPELAEQRLELQASELTWLDAAGSLRDGLPETLTQLSASKEARMDQRHVLVGPGGAPAAYADLGCSDCEELVLL